MQKPRLSYAQIWNMSIGFFGIQVGFALQNANVSRIFQTLGAEVDELAILWVAAPMTGLLVQPIIGYFSDRTWGRFGRRRPYFLAGAICASLALTLMPNLPLLWMAAGMLWVMDASINITMEPFRAFVGDNLPNAQRTAGFSMQTFFIGTGSVLASAMPYMLSNWFGIANTAEAGVVPPSVAYSFYAGAFFMLTTVLWTVFNSREYSPDELAAFATNSKAKYNVQSDDMMPHTPAFYMRRAMFWAAGGTAFIAVILFFSLEKELFIIGGGAVFFAVLLCITAWCVRVGRTDNALSHIIADLHCLPRVMQQLAVVQFLSWFALFAMWIYTTGAVTSFHFGAAETSTAAYAEGADWVGVMFAAYNAVAAVFALLVPGLAARFGRRAVYVACLLAGGLGLSSVLVFTDPMMLLLSMVGVGVAWAAILSLPYAILSADVPVQKMGIYMGIFNFFIVIPQLIAASILGLLVRFAFDGESIYALLAGGVSLGLAAIYALRLDDDHSLSDARIKG